MHVTPELRFAELSIGVGKLSLHATSVSLQCDLLVEWLSYAWMRCFGKNRIMPWPVSVLCVVDRVVGCP